MINYEDVVFAFAQHGDKLPREGISKVLKVGLPGLHIILRVLDEEERPSIRRWAIECIGSYQDVRSADILRKFSRSDYMTERLHTVIAIRNNNRLDMLDILEELALTDSSGGVRVNALSAILKLDASKAKSIAEQMTSDEKSYIRVAANKIINSSK